MMFPPNSWEKTVNTFLVSWMGWVIAYLPSFFKHVVVHTASCVWSPWNLYPSLLIQFSKLCHNRQHRWMWRYSVTLYQVYKLRWFETSYIWASTNAKYFYQIEFFWTNLFRVKCKFLPIVNNSIFHRLFAIHFFMASETNAVFQVYLPSVLYIYTH